MAKKEHVSRSARSTTPMIQDIIFDLDGTLIDSLPGIERAIIAAWSACCPGKPLPDLKPLLGPPIRKIFLTIDPHLSPEELLKLVAHFRHVYDTEACLDAALFPNCGAVLEQLLAQNKQLYIATNKPRKPTTKIIDYLELAPFFKDIVSLDSAHPPYSGKTEMLQAILSRHNLCCANTAMVGDAIEDGHAASECNIGFISARYGYGCVYTQMFTHGLFDLESISDLPKRLADL